MDVVTAEHAKIAEEAGAVAVMALERVPADIRADGGVARMSDPELITEIMKSVSIPVMAKVRIGHFVEAQILESLEVDYIDESEVLTPADVTHHINKHVFKTPFVCGCRNLGEALRRIGEGAAMIRTKGEAGTGDVVEAVRHARTVFGEIQQLCNMPEEELMTFAKNIEAPYELVKETRELGRLPVVNFAAGGIATPADAALMMQLGVDGVFVGSGIFKSGNPAKRGAAIVKAVTHFDNPEILAEVRISQEQVNELENHLNWIASVSSPELREDIEREQSRTPLQDFVGLSMNEALDYIENTWNRDFPTISTPTVPIIPTGTVIKTPQ